MLAVRGNAYFFATYAVTRERLVQVFTGILFFNVIWGFIWYGVKTLLLSYWVGFSKEERRQAFSSRMHAPFEVGRPSSRNLRAAHPHRRHDRPPRPVHHARHGRLLLPLSQRRRPTTRRPSRRCSCRTTCSTRW
jgi:hypothetical protein